MRVLDQELYNISARLSGQRPGGVAAVSLKANEVFAIITPGETYLSQMRAWLTAI